MNKIYLLTDYKDRFGNKHYDFPYRSGMDKEVLRILFSKAGYDPEFLPAAEVFRKEISFRDQYVLYTSSEDIGYHYKDFIEDIIYGLELLDAKLIPDPKFLRAHSNKVFMEVLRMQMNLPSLKDLATDLYGTLEELVEAVSKYHYPVVIKSAGGANSTGVYLAKNRRELIGLARRISRTKYPFRECWEVGRALKHKSYLKESKYRRRFIVQQFVPDLKNDWKIYIFGDKYYIFYRPVLKNREFRASGGGYENYFYGSEARQPEGILDFALDIFRKLDVPNVSLDITYDGTSFHLLEFQAIYFGTAGVLFSDCYFEKKGGKWQEQYAKLSIEEAYVSSIVTYLGKK
jgi:glutathione synthase/RimK-type ligase-like ATP-grasp enzyme